ncbi:MAG: hypothetical protein NC548_25995 [Lachnospiraceae bacterium]|nr:hypothetical protein [Lachnospiraceae bacterium]
MNIMNIQNCLGHITDKIYLINNNLCTSPFLKNINHKYGHCKGVVFDEFNAQSYFVDVMNDDSEYVYNCHYRRSLILPSKFKLTPKTIICNGSDRGVNLLKLTKTFIFNEAILKKHPDLIRKIFLIYSEVLNILYEDVEEIFRYQMFNSKEIYICHKDVQVELVQKTYEFIQKLCETFDEDVLNTRRCVGFLIEGFISSFFALKRSQEGYLIKYTNIRGM